jgi:hypothetical protein
VSPASVTIAARFCGPEHSGNGGYCAGFFAQSLPSQLLATAAPALAGTAAPEITLRRPPPLERPLRFDDSSLSSDGTARVRDGDQLIAEVRATRIEMAWPSGIAVPSFAEAEIWSTHFIAREHHSYPFCFVCGNKRAPRDGLRIHPGRLPGSRADGPVAAPFVPDASLANAAGVIPPEMVWAALDCTGYFGVYQPGTPNALLGRMAAVVDTVAPGEPCVATGWPLGGEGRKRFAGTALHGADGRLVGWSRQVWITV